MPTTVTATRTIDAPRELLFELIGDLSARPAFTDHFIDAYTLQRLEPTGVGASARFQIAVARKPIWMETVIAAQEPPHRILERGSGGRSDRVEINTAWTLAEGPTGTEVTVAFWWEADHLVDRLLGVVSRRRAKRGWERALERLAELAESGAEVERVRVAGQPRIPVRA